MAQILNSTPKPELLDCTGPDGANSESVETAQKVWADWLGVPVFPTINLGADVKLDMALIPPGKFMMGSPETEESRGSNETLHEVELTRPFYFARFPVTQEQYMLVSGTSNPSFFRNGFDGTGLDTTRFPVEQVKFHEAVEFCDRLTIDRLGKFTTFRLPTEAEWEYACRAGTRTPFHFGAFLNGFRANCDGNHPYGTPVQGKYLARTCEVGQYRANYFGLHDMHGNVWEWCMDWYAKYSTSKQVDPMGPQVASDDRMMRGGSWGNVASYCRAARRSAGGWGFYNNYRNLGFRIALVPSGSEPSKWRVE